MVFINLVLAFAALCTCSSAQCGNLDGSCPTFQEDDLPSFSLSPDDQDTSINLIQVKGRKISAEAEGEETDTAREEYAAVEKANDVKKKDTEKEIEKIHNKSPQQRASKGDRDGDSALTAPNPTPSSAAAETLPSLPVGDSPVGQRMEINDFQIHRNKEIGEEKLHVVYSTDDSEVYMKAAIASMASLINTSSDPGRIVIHFVGPTPAAVDRFQNLLWNGLRRDGGKPLTLECGSQLLINSLDELGPNISAAVRDMVPKEIVTYTSDTPRTEERSLREEERGIDLAKYVRFFTPDIVGPNVKYAVWLDADTLVVKDMLHVLHKFALHEDKSILLVKRYHNFTWPVQRGVAVPVETLREVGLEHPSSTIEHVLHNLGVIGFNIHRWQIGGILRKYMHWKGVDNKMHIFTDANQGPLAFALYDHTEDEPDEFAELDAVYNCILDPSSVLEQVPETDLNECFVLHWSSTLKPWGKRMVPRQELWQQYWHQAKDILAEEEQPIEALEVLQCAGIILAILGIAVFFCFKHGFVLVFTTMIYLLSLMSIKVTVRLVEHGYSFEFPLLITGIHFACSALLAFVLLVREGRTTGKTTAPTVEEIRTRFGPIAAAFAASVAMNNTALVHSCASFVEIVGNSQPVFTVMLMLVMREPFNLILICPCLVIAFGCALTSEGVTSFSWLGLLLAAGANIPRALKAVLQQKLMSAEGSAHSPLQVLAWTCLPASLIMLTWSLIEEGAEPYAQWYQNGFFSELTTTLLLSCINATILNTAALFVIKDFGAVGAQIVAQTQSILVVLSGMFFLNETVSALEWVGFALVMLGAYMYTRLEASSKAAQMAAFEAKTTPRTPRTPRKSPRPK